MASTFLHTVLQLAALYGIVAIAVCIAFRFLNFPDLTVDGSFVLGAVITARLIVMGIPCEAALLLASIAGFGAGVLTATFHRILGVNKFFAGILTMMMAYSINLRALGGANLSLLDARTVFGDGFQDDRWISLSCTFWLITVITGVLIIFHTILGLRLRALGGNPDACRESKTLQWMQLGFGLGISNTLAALCGGLVSQYQRFADVNMGLGVTVNGFAALFLGEALLVGVSALVGQSWARKLRTRLAQHSGAWTVRGEVLAAGIGVYLLLAVTTSTLYAGLPPSDLKMVAALILLVGMIFRRRRSSFLLAPVSRLE